MCINVHLFSNMSQAQQQQHSPIELHHSTSSAIRESVTAFILFGFSYKFCLVCYHQNVSDELRNDVREWGKSISVATVVDRLFGGTLVSMLRCEHCGTIRHSFEQFLDLSIPVVADIPPEQRATTSTNAAREGCCCFCWAFSFQPMIRSFMWSDKRLNVCSLSFLANPKTNKEMKREVSLARLFDRLVSVASFNESDL